MSADQVLRLSEAELLRTSKRGLLRMLREVCEQLQQERQAHRQEVAHLRVRMAEAALERQKATEQKINQTVNQPSAKKAEWEKDPPRGRRKRRHRGRAGAGNRAKPEPDTTHVNPLLQCPRCDTDLSERPTLDTPARIVEDIAPPPEKTIVTEEIQERKWCPTCQAVVSSRCDSALCGASIWMRTARQSG